MRQSPLWMHCSTLYHGRMLLRCLVQSGAELSSIGPAPVRSVGCSYLGFCAAYFCPFCSHIPHKSFCCVEDLLFSLSTSASTSASRAVMKALYDDEDGSIPDQSGISRGSTSPRSGPSFLSDQGSGVASFQPPIAIVLSPVGG